MRVFAQLPKKKSSLNEMGDNGSQVIDRVSVAWLEKQGNRGSK